ncbi:MAG TPA: hypothetical protein VFZ25_20800 [Chloroflexota bacterium]|nr:hypothetical protein [Chloroflexota bacterium]
MRSPMLRDGESPVDLASTELLRLNAVITGFVTGFFAGLAVFIATNWLLLKGGDVVGPHLGLLGQFFIGYTVSFVGSLIGFAYAFVVAFLVGFFVGRVYNWLIDLRHHTHERTVA